MVTTEKIRNIFLPSIIQSPSVGGKAGAITGISIFSLETNRSLRRTRNRSRIDFIRAGIIDAMEFMNKVFPLIIEVPLLLYFFFFFNKGEMKGKRKRERKGEREKIKVEKEFLIDVVELKAMGYHPFPSSLSIPRFFMAVSTGLFLVFSPGDLAS